MTLSTSVRPLDPIDHRDLFLLARKVAGIPAEWPFHLDDRSIIHQSGLPSAVCRVDAWYRSFEADVEPGDDYNDHLEWIVQFDTPYGFKDGGRNCDEIHADLVNALLAELAQRCVRAEWQDEYTGRWHVLPPGDTIHEWSA